MVPPTKKRSGGDEDSAPESTPGEQASMDVIARLVAHAINNPLAALVMDLDLAGELLHAPGAPPEWRERIDEIARLLVDARRAADRLHAVVDNLRASTSADDAVRALSAVPALHAGLEAAPRPGRAGRVLVVDDDALVARAVKRSLASHDVLVVSSGREALARLEAGDRFDVILCDLIMPDVTGMDLHDALLRVAPEQARRMVFVTGGPVTTRARDFVETTSNEVLEKPFDVVRLRDIVQRRLK